MGVYIDKFEPKYGLYQIDQGKIHKYKAKGGTVRTYPIQEIDLIRCEECNRSATDDGGNTFCMWLGALRTPTDFCSYGKRRSK